MSLSEREQSKVVSRSQNLLTNFGFVLGGIPLVGKIEKVVWDLTVQ